MIVSDNIRVHRSELPSACRSTSFVPSAAAVIFTQLVYFTWYKRNIRLLHILAQVELAKSVKCKSVPFFWTYLVSWKDTNFGRWRGPTNAILSFCEYSIPFSLFLSSSRSAQVHMILRIMPQCYTCWLKKFRVVLDTKHIYMLHMSCRDD